MTSLFFFFNDTATTEIYTLSLHDALPISLPPSGGGGGGGDRCAQRAVGGGADGHRRHQTRAERRRRGTDPLLRGQARPLQDPESRGVHRRPAAQRRGQGTEARAARAVWGLS